MSVRVPVGWLNHRTSARTCITRVTFVPNNVPQLHDRLTDVAGIAVGHWSDPQARTGCTVVLVPEGTVASIDVQGGSPASRETALLEPARSVQTIDAVVLTGGSAFGLASADGCVAHLETLGRGHVTPFARVPIVPALGLFDLGVGDPSVRPGAAQGRFAAEQASTKPHEVGLVGAGTGCTVDKWLGVARTRPAGLVAASALVGEVVIATLIAVNAVGSVGTDVGDGPAEIFRAPTDLNTTIGVVATSATLDKVACKLLAQSAHDALARTIFPTHTRYDGDAFIAVATGREPALDAMAAPMFVDALRIAVTRMVARAILTLTNELNMPF